MDKLIEQKKLGKEMAEEELDAVSGGTGKESREIVGLIMQHFPGIYKECSTLFGGIGSDCEKMLAKLGITAETGAFDDNLYREKTTGRYIRHDELKYWISHGCKEDAKPWRNPDIEV